jgi:uncharacterized LabA/DUF88 family protein
LVRRILKKKQLRTIVYVDGFNFYCGQLRGTPWKWLDLVRLFEMVLGPQNDLVKVKYFTAKVQPTIHDPDVNLRQDTYFRAMRRYCEKVEIHLGHFLRHQVSMEHANPPPDIVKVWKNEEKGSDVNLALHLLNDAWLDFYDCAVVVSNDSDLATSLKMVRSQHRKVIGLITPGAPKRKTSRQLLSNTDFVKPIRTHALKAALLPNPIPGTRIHKPLDW